MSYWVYLVDENGPVELYPHYNEGGTFKIDGYDRAELNITYNYSAQYELLGFSIIRDLHDRKARDVVHKMADVVMALGITRDPDPMGYWKPTPGNAGYALNILLMWAIQYPDAIFQVS
jgi:hypothetical protein